MQSVEGDDIQNTLASMTGSSTVPQLFIGGKYIGGFDGEPWLQVNDLQHLCMPLKILTLYINKGSSRVSWKELKGNSSNDVRSSCLSNVRVLRGPIQNSMKIGRFSYQASSSFIQSLRANGIFDCRQRRPRPCLCRQHSFDTEFQKCASRRQQDPRFLSRAMNSGSEIPSTPIDVGWLWELSAKTTRVKLDPLRMRPKK